MSRRPAHSQADAQLYRDMASYYDNARIIRVVDDIDSNMQRAAVEQQKARRYKRLALFFLLLGIASFTFGLWRLGIVAGFF